MEIISKIMDKINAVIAYLIIAGIIFLAIGILIILYPAVIVYLFVVCFAVLAVICFLSAERVFRIKELVEKLTLFKK